VLSSLHPGQSLLKRSAMETEMLGCFLGRFGFAFSGGAGLAGRLAEAWIRLGFLALG
jgi:hypothetical protein